MTYSVTYPILYLASLSPKEFTKGIPKLTHVCNIRIVFFDFEYNFTIVALQVCATSYDIWPWYIGSMIPQ